MSVNYRLDRPLCFDPNFRVIGKAIEFPRKCRGNFFSYIVCLCVYAINSLMVYRILMLHLSEKIYLQYSESVRDGQCG